MKTSYVPTQSEIQRQWHLVDADGVILGKLASRVAMILQGKHKPTYTPFLDTGDFVVVINADKVKMTGKKPTDKMYSHYTGHPGGLREYSAEELMKKHPGKVVELAVKRMLPKSTLGKHMFKKLKVYGCEADFDGEKHPHRAQKPQPLVI